MRWTKEAKRPSTTPTTVETQKLEFIGRFENISNKNFFFGKKIPVNTERERTIISPCFDYQLTHATLAVRRRAGRLASGPSEGCGVTKPYT